MNVFENSFALSVVLTFSWALIVTVLAVSFGYRLGRGLARLQVRPELPLLLLLPALIGDLTTSVLAREYMLGADGSSASPFMVWVAIGFAEISQGLPLVAFFSWLQLSSLPSEMREFVHAHQLSSRQRAALLEFPAVKPTLYAISAFVFLLAFWEASSVLEVLHASRARGGNLVSIEIATKYSEFRSLLNVGALKARNELAWQATGAAFLGVIFTGLVWGAIERKLHAQTNSNEKASQYAFPAGWSLYPMFYFLPVILAIPAFWVTMLGIMELSKLQGFFALGSRTFMVWILALVCAAFIVVPSVLILAAVRLWRPNFMSRLSWQIVLIILVGAFLARVIAPELLTYHYSAWVAPHLPISADERGLWGVLQIILWSFLAVLFLYLMNLAVPSKRLELLNLTAVGLRGWRRKFVHGFLRPLAGGYIAIAIVLTVAIGFEAGVTDALVRVESLPKLTRAALDGRGAASYADLIAITGTSVLLMFALISLLSRQLHRSRKDV